jgi:hypothetical protein
VRVNARAHQRVDRHAIAADAADEIGDHCRGRGDFQLLLGGGSGFRAEQRCGRNQCEEEWRLDRMGYQS